jgi:hypothetical protein
MTCVCPKTDHPHRQAAHTSRNFTWTAGDAPAPWECEYYGKVFFLVSSTKSSLILSHRKTNESQIQNHLLENFYRVRNYFCDFIGNQCLHDSKL